MNRLTKVGSERESCPCGSLNHLYGAFLLGFLWSIILLCLVVVRIWFISGSSPVCVRLLAKMDSSEEVYGEVDITYYGVVPPLFLAPEEPFCACVVGEVSLILRMRNMWSLYLFSGQSSAPPSSCYCLHLGVSVYRGQGPAAQPGAHLSPASVLQSLKHNGRVHQY